MQWLVGVLGLAAMAGGALRIVDSFTTQMFSAGTLAMLYFLTDVLLLLGIAGIYWSRRDKVGIAGVGGMAIFTIGIILIRVAAFGGLGASGYRLGAAVAVLGLALVSAEALLLRNGLYLSALSWLAALALGVAGAFGVTPDVMTILAGVAFGAGFVAAGLNITRN